VKLINTLQITQKKRYDREMGSSEAMVEKDGSSSVSKQRERKPNCDSIDFGAGKNAAWALQIMWALHRKVHHTIHDLPLIGEAFQDVS
jgi:hypothetical protein